MAAPEVVEIVETPQQKQDRERAERELAERLRGRSCSRSCVCVSTVSGMYVGLADRLRARLRIRL